MKLDYYSCDVPLWHRLCAAVGKTIMLSGFSFVVGGYHLCQAACPRKTKLLGTSRAILKWANDDDVDWHYIEPGKPQQSALTKSFADDVVFPAYDNHDT